MSCMFLLFLGFLMSCVCKRNKTKVFGSIQSLSKRPWTTHVSLTSTKNYLKSLTKVVFVDFLYVFPLAHVWSCMWNPSHIARFFNHYDFFSHLFFFFYLYKFVSPIQHYRTLHFLHFHKMKKNGNVFLKVKARNNKKLSQLGKKSINIWGI